VSINAENLPWVVVHELIHALGFGHEHQHADRDGYIEVFMQNVNPQSQSGYALSKQNLIGPL